MCITLPFVDTEKSLANSDIECEITKIVLNSETFLSFFLLSHSFFVFLYHLRQKSITILL